MSDTTVMNAASEAIEAAGWQRKNSLAAEKHFDSIVGPKLACIWVGRQADQVGNFTVSGVFWSEGRNVLEPQGLILNVEDPVEEIPGLIQQFLLRIEEKISDSFAVRLLES